MNGVGVEQAGLGRLQGIVAEAMAALGHAGASELGEVHLHVVGRHAGRHVGDLFFDQGRFNLVPTYGEVAIPDALGLDEEANRRALTLAELCFVMVLWDLDTRAACRCLGCTAISLDRWMSRCVDRDVPEIPSAVMQRIRRLITIEQLRLLAGVADLSVTDWVRTGRAAFGGESVLGLIEGGELASFRRVLLWMLNDLGGAQRLH
jgi:hypothetical protein